MSNQKKKPILFSTPMVQSLLNGTKRKTRRLCEKYIQSYAISIKRNILHEEVFYAETKKTEKCPPRLDFVMDTANDRQRIHPKWEKGDTLWVRETFRLNASENYEYKATAEIDGTPLNEPWKPSIFMPREACRIQLHVVDITIERLQDITEADAILEGVKKDENGIYYDYISNKYSFHTAVDSFKSLWIKINGLASWESNPYVWVYHFDNISTR